MASANIGATGAPAKTTRPASEIIDEIRRRSYDLCGLAAVVERIADSDPPGTWCDVFYFLRDTLSRISLDLVDEADELLKAEDGR